MQGTAGATVRRERGGAGRVPGETRRPRNRPRGPGSDLRMVDLTSRTVAGITFSKLLIDEIADRNDPKCPLGWHRHYAERVARDFDEIRPFLDLTERMMDIGCG